MNKKILLFSVILLVCILVTLSFGQYRPYDSFRPEKIAAPDFSLKDLQGKTFKLSKQRGNPVVIFFGATWCPACRAEMPNYKALYEKYARRGLKFIYIDINESTERVARFAKTNSFPYLVLVDTDGIAASDYNLVGVPTLFLINKEGNIISIGHQVSDLSIDALFPDKK
ncbi:MAG: TlpA disulfide reductase family protein [Smithella sp.]|jgi:peroxiredoxin